MSQTKTYVEDKNFVPNPTDQFGTLDTSGTAGAAHSRIEEISPIFRVAEQQSALNAARALDPNDDSVPASAVVLPDGGARSREDAEKVVKDRAAKAKKELGGTDLVTDPKGPAQKDAAESGDEAGTKANAERESQGAGKGTDGSAAKKTAAAKA